MSRVTILSRDVLQRVPSPGRFLTEVAVAYQADLLPPRVVYLPFDNYDQDQAAPVPTAGVGVIKPKDNAAQAAEDDAIRQDIAVMQSFAPQAREI